MNVDPADVPAVLDALRIAAERARALANISEHADSYQVDSGRHRSDARRFEGALRRLEAQQ